MSYRFVREGSCHPEPLHFHVIPSLFATNVIPSEARWDEKANLSRAVPFGLQRNNGLEAQEGEIGHGED